MKPIFTLLFCLFSIALFAQNDCAYMHEGKFKDLEDKDPNAYMLVDENYFTDYFNNGESYIKSSIEWTDDCHYTLTFIESNAPDMQLEPGTKLKVEILEVSDGIIRYQYLPAGELPERKLMKIE